MTRVLVIEDEEDLAAIVDYNLRQAGYEVSLAGRGKDGLRLAAESPPDLVILDLMLPDLPGADVCRSLKGDPRTSPLYRIYLPPTLTTFPHSHTIPPGL